MGYYADLIKEKKEKQNFRDPLFTRVVGLGTPDDYKAKFKKGDKVKLKGSNDEGIIVEGPIKMRMSLTPTYKIKLEDGKVVGRYEEELKKNSKEEKDNASVQDRFRYKGCMITILKKGENQYTFSVEQNGREEGANATYPTQDKAEAEAKREVEANWNEKEETENASEADIRAMYSQIQELKKKGIKGENIDKFYAAVNYRAAAEEHRKKYKQTGQEGYRIAAEKADRQADQWIKEINRSIRNEKEKGYYAKLAEEKKDRQNASASFRFHGKSFQYDPNNIDSVLSAARKIEDYKEDLGDEPSLQREYIAIQREIATARDKAEKAESKYRISGQDIHEWRI